MDSSFPVLIAYPNFYPRLWGIPAVGWITRWLLTGLFRCPSAIPVAHACQVLAVAWLASVVKFNTGILDMRFISSRQRLVFICRAWHDAR
jgi:hypothetical protein